MKRFVTFAAIFAVSLSLVFAGGKKESSSDTISVVATIFPAYDWAKEIIGTNNSHVKLTMLLDTGVDLHSYQPTVKDIATISTCDVFIYVGGESDDWVTDVLAQAKNPNMQVINLMEVMGDKAKAEEIKEGMQAEDEHDEADYHEHHHDDDDDEVEYDEHVWLSLRNVQYVLPSIANALCSVDAANAALYKANLDSYTKELKNLDAEYTKEVTSAQITTLVFGDRFPFRYLVDDYNLDYYAAFVGCSAETEASFETILFLVNKIDELSLKSVFVIESSDKKIAQTIIDNSKDKSRSILVLDSMQSTTSKNVKAGATYLNIMKENLAVLKKGLH